MYFITTTSINDKSERVLLFRMQKCFQPYPAALRLINLFKINFEVLFWIYGGGFIFGGESFYDARAIASLHDVVVVIPNYRVSIFGFLALGRDTDHPGNMGLLDQIMAMK